MKEFKPNGEARVGHRPRVGKTEKPEVVRSLAARITDKLVTTVLHRFDRATGKDRGRRDFSVWNGRKRLLAYRLDGKEWTEIAT